MSPARAADTNWTGAGGDSNWNNPANWSNGLPTGNDWSRIGGGLTATVDGVNANLNGWTFVGTNNSNAHLDVINGGQLSGGCCFYLGSQGTGTATVSGAGSSISGSNTVFVVGQSTGTGELLVENGGHAGSNASIMIGRYSNSVGTITVTGAGSTVTSRGNLQLGGESSGSTTNAQGTLNVLAGGLARAGDTGTRQIIIANSHGSTGTVNIGNGGAPGIVQASSIRFGNGNGTLNFNHTDAGYNLTVPISGGGQVRQVAGTTILSGSNSWSGGTAVEGGELRAGSSGALSSSTSYTVNGGTLNVNGFNRTIGELSGNGGTVQLGSATLTVSQTTDSTYSGVIAGTGALTKAGTGTLTLAGNNTYSGGTTVNAGTLKGSHASLQGDIANSAKLIFDQAASGTFAGVISGTGTLEKSGAGTLTLTGANTHSGGTTVSAGELRAGASNTLSANDSYTVDAGTLNLNGFDHTITGLSGSGGNVQLGSATLTVSQTADSTYSGVVAGTGALTKAGAGTLTLAGNNTYSGGTTVGAGTVKGTHESLQGDIVNSAKLIFDQAASGTFAGNISGTGTLEKRGAGTLTLTGANSHSGDTMVEGGELKAGASGALSANGSYTVNAGTLNLNGFNRTITGLSGSGGDVQLGSATLTVSQTADGTYSGVIAGTGALTKAGAGKLTLAGNNTYTGGTTVSAGTLQGNHQSLQGDIINSASLVLDQSADGTFTGNISGTGTLEKRGTGKLTLTGANSYSGGTTVSAGTLQGNHGSLQGNIANSANVVFDQAANGTYAGNISGIGTFEKRGAGALILTGNNTHAGGTTVSAGTLQGDYQSLQGDITNSASVVFDQAASGTFASDISGAGTLEKRGVGALTLTGTNTYSGGTTVSAGTLQGDHQSLQGDIANSASVVFDQATDGTFSSGISGTGTLEKRGVGKLTLTGANSYSGGTTVSAGTLQGNHGTLQGDIANAATLVFDQAADGTFAGKLSGNGALEKRGAGALTLSGDSSAFSGTTSVAGGTLFVNGTLGGAVNIGGSGQLAGSGAVSGSVDVGGTLTAGNSPGTLTIGGDLGLGATSTSVFELGVPGVVGGASNDLVKVGGNLTMGGTLRASVASAGYYRLFEYGGTLSGTFTNETVSSSNAGFTLDRHRVVSDLPGQVNLTALGAGQQMQFWDGADTAGDGALGGGSGTWSAGSGNWTDAAGRNGINDIWRGSVGVFAGAAGGTVTASGAVGFDTLQFSTDGYRIEGGTLNAVPEAGGAATINVDGGISATIASTIGSGGRDYSLTKAGAGTLILTGANTYSGSTTVSAGTLQGSHESLQGNIANAARLVFDQAGDGTFAGAISGTGSLEKRGAGTLTLAAANTYSGGTTVSAGTLQGSHTSLQGDIANAAKLVFDQAGNGTYAGRLSGNGTLEKRGAGTLTFSGDSSAFAGSTTILGGELMVDGSLGGALSVDGGWLGGSGTLANLIIGNGGTLAPGNSIGTTNTTNLTQAAGSTYEVEVNDGGNTAGVNNDITIATGTATLDPGATVHVKPDNGTDDGSTYTPGIRYTIITANGGVNGTFNPTVKDDFALLDGVLSYDATNVYLTLNRLLQLDQVGTTTNQKNVGAMLEAIGTGNPVYDALLVVSDQADIVAALDDLSGELHASAHTVLSEDAFFLRGAINDRLRTTFDASGFQITLPMAYGAGASTTAPTYGGSQFWARGLGSAGRWDGVGGAATLERTAAGAIFGGDAELSADWRIGWLAGYTHSAFDAAARASSGSAQGYHVGAYGGGQLGRLGLRFGGSYGWHQVDTARAVVFPGFTDTLSASYHATSAQLFGEAGYRFDMADASAEPFAGLAFVQTDSDGYSESGGAAALTVAGRQSHATFSTLGVRAHKDFTTRAGTQAKLTGAVAWRHGFGDLTPDIQATLAGGPAFTATGTAMARDALLVDLGARVKLGATMDFGVDYRGQIGADMQDHGVSASLSFKF